MITRNQIKEMMLELSPVESRMAEIDAMQEDTLGLEELRSINQEYDGLSQRRTALKAAIKAAEDEYAEQTRSTKLGNPINKPNERNSNMNDNELRLEAFQKFVTRGAGTMTDIEMRALDLSGAAAALPVEIYNELITGTKYADLLPRASVLNIPNAGPVYIPIASDTAATWRTELDPGAEASPTLTKIELNGYELMRLMQMSAAAASMTVGDFQQRMTELLGAEVLDTLETSFITGTGIGQSKGLDHMTWDASNQVLTDSAADPITPSHIARGLGLLPAKYSRGAVVLMNSVTFYSICEWEDATGRPVLAVDRAADKFFGRDVVLNEHVANDVVYLADPKQLYVRFASPISVEADRSSGFTSASIYLRSLCVVDAKWNPAACVRVGLGT